MKNQFPKDEIFKQADNVLVVGSKDSDRSAVVSQLIAEGRSRGLKQVIRDDTGTHLKKHFRPGVDFVIDLNDESGVDWNVLADIKLRFDVHMLSKHLIPRDKVLSHRAPLFEIRVQGAINTALHNFAAEHQMSPTAAAELFVKLGVDSLNKNEEITQTYLSNVQNKLILAAEEPEAAKRIVDMMNKNAEKSRSNDEAFVALCHTLFDELVLIAKKKNGAIADVKDILEHLSLQELFDLLNHYEAMSRELIKPENAKLVESIRLTLLSLPAIQMLSRFNQNAAFSLSEFIAREDDACLFLVGDDKKDGGSEAILNAVVKFAQHLAFREEPKDEKHAPKIMFVHDGAFDLASCETGVTRGRRWGLLNIFAMQSMSAAEDAYGKDETKSFLSNMHIQLFLRCESADDAKVASGYIGLVKGRKFFGIEFGKRLVVTPEEIMSLPDLTGYMRRRRGSGEGQAFSVAD